MIKIRFKYYFFSIIFISCLSFAQNNSQIKLPELGDRVSGAVSSAQEKAIGEAFLKQAYAQAPLINDSLIQEYTELLVFRLSEKSKVQDRYFNVLLIDDPSLNAFAAPGSIIGVNGGLFLEAENEGQFASVMAHELAHLSQRHFARNVLRSQDSSLSSALVLVSSIAIALITNQPQAIIGGSAFMQQENLRYSRLFEKEADRVGFTNLVASGYDPYTMGEMFENMNRMKRYYGEAPPEFLLTHPVTSSRVNDAFNAAESIDASGSKKDSLDYSFIRSRLKVYYEKIPASSVSYFKDAFKKSNLPSDHYGLALALNKNNEFENSISVINDLIDRFPKNLILNTTRVEIYLNAGLYQEASNHVDEFLSISPGNYPLTITKAKILNETGEYFAAEELLREQLLKRNGDPYLWLLLSDIQRDGKNVVGYYQSKAEYHFLLGQYEEAISQLEFALQLTKNNFQVSESVMTKIIDIKNKINKSRGL
ncbi:M48 family metalloprotease [Gammaproteobacteria bacterium]|nr:M48 family metalloprotease [Gammaproteobacteria bacterium]